MVFSIHTFELVLLLDTKEFNKTLSLAYKQAKGGHRIYQDDYFHKDYAFTSIGIKIQYHFDKYKKKIKFIVNPSKVLGGNDLNLWIPDKTNIMELIDILESCIDDYFDGNYELDNFELNRVDFTININVGMRENVTAYIQVLHKIGKVKGFSPKYSERDDGIDKRLSFDLEGNSNGMEFTAYDKEGESRHKDAKGILRVEVRLTKKKAIRKYTDKTTTSKQIKHLAKQSESIFMETFLKVVPRGDYYKKKDAIKIVKDSISKKKLREKMIQLLDLIPKKKSLLLAQKELDYRNIDRIMDMFTELNLSPVTIPKRVNVTYLMGLYSFF